MDRIPVAGPWITQLEIDYVRDAVANCWYGLENIYHDRFERAFAEYVGRRYAVTLPSCTAAIHLALASVGVGPGDEVIVPDVTWIASAAPASYLGAEPVFADIDPVTWCISPASIERLITEKTRAIVAVDLYGSMPDMSAVAAIASQNQVALIEDAAEAFGSEFRGGKAGSFGDASVFSFHGTKTMTTGEGGMLVTDREDLYRRVLFLRDHGRTPGDRSFFHSEVAFKYKMSSMQAALGLAQVERAGQLVQRRREIFSWYVEALADAQWLQLNAEPAGTFNSYWMVTAVIDPALKIPKEQAIERLAQQGIDCRPFFYPLSLLPAYHCTSAATNARAHNVHAYSISPYGINLPSNMRLTRDQVTYVADCVRQLASQKSCNKQCGGCALPKPHFSLNTISHDHATQQSKTL